MTNNFTKATVYFLINLLSVVTCCAQQLVSPQWQCIQKKIVVRSGLEISAWDNSDDRADVCIQQYNVRAAAMYPSGDGTYEIRFELYPGNSYNFVFFAVSTQPLPSIAVGHTYYDTVPNSGSDNAFIVSTTPVTEGTFVNLNCAGYTSIGGDARRFITIPDWLAPGTTFYVYCNWSSSPTVVRNLRARPKKSAVELSWQEPLSYWGGGEESHKVIDVIVGGEYIIMKSTSAGGPYSIVATTPGYCFSWTDTDVQNGNRYFYIIVVRDAYDSVLELESSKSYEVTAVPNEPINIRFRVENIDLEKVKKKFDNIVYLTPENVCDKYSIAYKIPGRIVYCTLRKKFLGMF